MATTGKRFIDRTSDRSIHRLLDSRTKALLNAVLAERPGGRLNGYIRARGLG